MNRTSNPKRTVLKSRVPRIFRVPKALYISSRAARVWERVGSNLGPLGIKSQISPKEYTAFVSSFHPQKIEGYSLRFSRGSTNNALTLTLSKRISRSLSSIFLKRPKAKELLSANGARGFFARVLDKLSLRGNYNLFKAKLTITKEIEPELSLPFDRGKGLGVCAIVDLIGPSSRKYKDTQALAQEARDSLGDNWQSFLLQELSIHAKAQGCSAVALLRPKNNPDLTDAHLREAGVSEEGAKSIRSHYFAAARKASFRKIQGSKYFWKIF